MKIFDTHAHYDDSYFDDDRNELIEGKLRREIILKKEDEESLKTSYTSEEESEERYEIVNVTNIGCDMESSRTTLALAEENDYIYASIGVIPHHTEGMSEANMEELRKMAKSSDKVVAIGEIGLDYYYDEPAREIQHKWFREQMELARELELPIVIHSREAAQDTFQMMKEAHAEEIGGVIHCYSYSEEMSREFMKLGFFFGIGGAVTFKNSKKLKRAVAAMPLENIVLETDSPYLTPAPFRGKRNDSRYLPYVIREIARLKEITPEEVAETTYRNALKLYRIKV